MSCARAVRDVGRLLTSHGIERADGEGAGPAGELGRADDGRLPRHRDVASVRLVGVALGPAPDPARVEQAGALAVVAVQIEAEIAGALHEERAPLLVERLEGRQVHDGRIRLDLPEIGVHRARQCQARRQGALEIGAGRGRASRGFHEGVPRLHRLGVDLADRVGHQLETLGRTGEAQAAEFTERRDEAGGAFRHERPGRRFVQARHLAPDREPERVALAGLVAQLGERDAELG